MGPSVRRTVLVMNLLAVVGSIASAAPQAARARPAASTRQRTAIAVGGVVTFTPQGKTVAASEGEYYGDLPAWSPDHRKIAYIVLAPSKASGVWVMNADGTHRKRIAAGQYPTKPCWSPDGKRLAFIDSPVAVGRHQKQTFSLFLVDEPTGKVSALLRVKQHYESFNPAPSATWSPDGQWIAFTAHYTTQSQVWLIRPTGQGLHKLPGLPRGECGHPDWSPHGDRLLFSVDPSGRSEGSLYTIRPDGTGLRHLHLDGFVGPAAWSPDGRKIVYRRGIRGHLSAIAIASPDGSGQTVVRGPNKEGDPDW